MLARNAVSGLALAVLPAAPASAADVTVPAAANTASAEAGTFMEFLRTDTAAALFEEQGVTAHAPVPTH